MLTIAEYVMPRTVSEAYTLLTTTPNAAVVGGGAFMRLASREIGLAIDLTRAELDYIRETATEVTIGAMTTFGAMERSRVLQTNWDGLLPRIIGNIAGVQLRNIVTVGGTVYGRFGFSEVLTGLMALECSVKLHQGGLVSLADFVQSKGRGQDIVEAIVIAKNPQRAAYQMLRNSGGSLPILSVAVTKSQHGPFYRIAVGARPGVSALAVATMSLLAGQELHDDLLRQAATKATSELRFTSDRKASAVYRQELCGVLVKRALAEVGL